MTFPINVNVKKDLIGLGIAGNFTGHLEQAGEAKDFKNLKGISSQKPKGIFPFYLPNHTSKLGTFPLDSEKIILPPNQNNVQIEPEMAVLFEIEYAKSFVENLKPLYFTAYNDCSIRVENAPKISNKKNWGKSSKGVSDSWIPIDSFTPESALQEYSIICYLSRETQIHQYGVTSPIANYSLFYGDLIEWLIEKMNKQVDEGPLENISHMIQKTNFPKYALVSLGATTYTPFGESNFLMPGDTSIVGVYNHTLFSEDSIIPFVLKGDGQEGNSILIQKVLNTPDH